MHWKSLFVFCYLSRLLKLWLEQAFRVMVVAYQQAKDEFGLPYSKLNCSVVCQLVWEVSGY